MLHKLNSFLRVESRVKQFRSKFFRTNFAIVAPHISTRLTSNFSGFERWNEYSVIDRINSPSFPRSSIHLERRSRDSNERFRESQLRTKRRTFKRLISRPATSNVFLSRRFIARFLLQDRGQCARTLLL